MKSLLKNMLLLSFIVALSVSCDEDETEGLSKVTEFPEFEMTDAKYYFHEKGETYEEPGITAYEGGEEVPVETSGSVNSDEAGVYTIEYTATNSDGYSKSVKRYVIVHHGGIADNDLTGTYAGGYYGDGTMEMTKIKNGLYQSTDVFGYGPPYPTPGKIVDLGEDADGVSHLVVLPTSSAFGAVFKTPGTYTDQKLAYTLGIAGYGYIFAMEWIKQ